MSECEYVGAYENTQNFVSTAKVVGLRMAFESPLLLTQEVTEP